MKKFKSLMLAALASAAFAAPGFAAGHGPSMSGEIVVGMKYSSYTIDENPNGSSGDTQTAQDTYIGDINAKLTNAVGDSASYAFEFEQDDEDTDGNVNFEMTGTAASGDNSIKAFAEMQDITGSAGEQGLGDAYVRGGNKTLTVQIGKFGGSENYAGGMGYYRAGLGNNSGTDGIMGTDDDPGVGVGNIEHVLVDPFEGIEIDINAGDIQLEFAVPWMTAAAGSGYALNDSSGKSVATNVTGIRPNIKANLGSVGISATFYTLSFTAQDGGVGSTQEKMDQAYQLMGSVAAGSATVGFGYTSKTTKNHNTELTPSTLNGYVKVALGGSQNVGASFEILGDGAEENEATATRISASYDTPFFVEAVTLKLGAGSTTQSSDDNKKAGSASGLEAEWVYNF
jgi:hypothetical protein